MNKPKKIVWHHSLKEPGKMLLISLSNRRRNTIQNIPRDKNTLWYLLRDLEGGNNEN